MSTIFFIMYNKFYNLEDISLKFNELIIPYIDALKSLCYRTKIIIVKIKILYLVYFQS